MAEINDLEVTDDDNTARFPEGMLISQVNNQARKLEGIIARHHKDNNGTIAVNGANTYTASINVDSGFALYDGYTIVADFANANTGAATINLTPDGGSALGAKAIVKGQSTALAGGEIAAGQKVALIYNGTAFQMMSPTASNVEANVDYAEEWANKAEDSLISTAAGGDGSTEYSARHWAAKSAADVVLTNADVVLTNADVVSTNADVVSTGADAAAASASAAAAAASEAAAAAAAQGWADVVSITAGTTNIEITDANKYYILDASGGSITMNLPAVGTSDGLTLAFEVLDASNSITIARDGTDTINGSAADYTSLTGVGDVVHFISIDGTPDNWSARLISRFVVDGSTITQSGRTISVGTGGVDTTQLADDAVDPTKAIAGRNSQSGTTYTLALTDNLKTVSLSNASAVAVTIPTNASIAFTADETRIDIVNIGAGEVTVSGDTGVTVNGVSAGSFTLAQYAGASLLKIDTNTWLAPNSTVA